MHWIAEIHRMSSPSNHTHTYLDDALLFEWKRLEPMMAIYTMLLPSKSSEYQHTKRHHRLFWELMSTGDSHSSRRQCAPSGMSGFAPQGYLFRIASKCWSVVSGKFSSGLKKNRTDELSPLPWSCNISVKSRACSCWIRCVNGADVSGSWADVPRERGEFFYGSFWIRTSTRMANSNTTALDFSIGRSFEFLLRKGNI